MLLYLILLCFFFLSDSVGIQTQDLQNRNLTLYSAKLRSQMMLQRYCKVWITPNEAETDLGAFRFFIGF